MTVRPSGLRAAITLALAAGAMGTAAPAVAQAQAGDATTLDRIEVTGSRIRSADVETSQPVYTISREDLQEQGFVSVADILQNVSAAGTPPFSRTSPLTTGEGAGGTYVDLRNLGAARTLVLVNGKRLGITTGGLQDVASIPVAMIQRIDVLKDGASTIYGSDAVAGVINIVTRTRFEGLELSAYTGQYGEGDGDTHSASLVSGVSMDRGYMTFGAEYRTEGEVWARDRAFSQFTNPSLPDGHTTPVSKWGNFNLNTGLKGPDGKDLPAVWYVAERGGDALGLDDFREMRKADDYVNSNDQMHLSNPLKAWSAFVAGAYELTDRVALKTDFGYSHRNALTQIAGYPLQSTSTFGEVAGFPMHANSYFNPVGRTVHFRRRGWEVPRTNERDLSTLRFSTSLEGSFDVGERYFDWDIGGLYSRSESLQLSRGDFHVPNVKAAVGPSFLNADGKVQCGTPANPIPLSQCIPWNPFAGFGTGKVENSLADPALQALLFPITKNTGETTTTLLTANLSGLAFTLPAGDVTFAVGAENRTEEGEFLPDELAQRGVVSSLAAGATRGKYHLMEYYGELGIPLLSQAAFAEELFLSIASRYSDYSTFGDTTNSKVGLKWKPVDEVLVRGTWSEGFRAPNIANLFGGGSQTFVTGFKDPCDSVYGAARGSARCLQDVPVGYRQLQQGFIPITGPQAQTPVPFMNGSNPNLQPEEAETKTVGVVWSPDFIEGLNLSVDWWNIRIDSTLVADTANAILSDCYVSLIESRCAMIGRHPTMFIVDDLTIGLRNAGYTETEGFDVGASYATDTSLGRFGANWDTTYTSVYDYKADSEASTVIQPQVGFWDTSIGAVFRVRSNLKLDWSRGNFGASWTMRYHSAMKETCDTGSRCSHPDFTAPWLQGSFIDVNRSGSTTFNDVQFFVKTPWNARVAIGANNVLDKQAALAYSQPASNYSYYGNFDIGRFVYLRYDQSF